MMSNKFVIINRRRSATRANVGLIPTSVNYCGVRPAINQATSATKGTAMGQGSLIVGTTKSRKHMLNARQSECQGLREI